MRKLVLAWVLQHGYLGLSSLLMLGIVGVPVPDETLLVFTGYLVFRGDLHLFPAILAGFAGTAIGITVSYLIGRGLGRRLVSHYGCYFHLDAARMNRVSSWYARGGNWSLTFGYFVPGFRHVAALVAGASGVPFHSLVLFAYPGGLAWVATFITIGKVFGREWQWVADGIESHLYIAFIVAAAAIAAYWLLAIRGKSARQDSQSRGSGERN